MEDNENPAPNGVVDTEFGKMRWSCYIAGPAHGGSEKLPTINFDNPPDSKAVVNRIAYRVSLHGRLKDGQWRYDHHYMARDDFKDPSGAARSKVQAVLLALMPTLATPRVIAQAKVAHEWQAMERAKGEIAELEEKVAAAKVALHQATERFGAASAARDLVPADGVGA